jgi:surface protein
MADELIFNEPAPSPIYFGDPTDIGTVKNSDGTYSVNVHSGVTVLPDIDFTDSDGVTSLVPAVKDIVATPHHGADVENSDGSYTAHVNDAATLVVPDSAVTNTDNTYVFALPATQPHVVPDSNINNSDSSYHVSLPAAQPIVIPDSVVSNSDDTYIVNLPATNALELPDITVTRKNANGQPIVTALPAMTNYTEVGSVPDANGWIRPADWLPISHLVTDGEEKVAALYAVWDAAGIAKGYNNYCALYVTGNYTVDWGDGTVENFASGVQAEHEYVYANMPASSYCSRGYRQAVITITPQAGQHLTLLNFGKKHSLNSVTYATNNFLDVYVSGTDIGRITMYDANNSQSRLLEKFYGYQLSNKCTTMYAMFNSCYSLHTLDLSSFNTSAVTSMAYMFYSCYSLQTLDLSSFNTATVTTMSNMFYNCYSLQTLDLSSFNTAAVTSMAYMFANCYSLHTLDLSSFNTSTVTTMPYMFYNCYSLRGINLSHTSLLKVTDNTQITNSTGQLLICRLPLIAKTFTVASNQLTAAELNALFGDLKDLTGVTAQTITITGNPGAGTCDQSIATAKNWIVVN